MPKVWQTCLQGIFKEWETVRMRAETMAPSTPAGPAHLTAPVATSTLQSAPSKWGLHKGPLKGSPWGIRIRPGATDMFLGRKGGLWRASTAAGSEGAACGFSIRWQRKAMNATEQNLEGTGNPWTQFEIRTFAFFVSGATGISWLIWGSIKLISSFRQPLCCPPCPQPGDCDPSYSLLHSTAKIWISKDKCHRCSTSPVEPRSLFVIAVSLVNACSISLWAGIFHPAGVKSTSIYSVLLYAGQLPHCGERKLWSAAFVYIIVLVSGQLWGQRLMFFIYSLSTLIWIFLCLLLQQRIWYHLVSTAEILLEIWGKVSETIIYPLHPFEQSFTLRSWISA